MTTRKNYYKILQVDPSADPTVIKAAYRTLMLHLKNHPDYGGNHQTAQIINEAYQALKDPRSRQMYDYRNFFYIQKNKTQPATSSFCMRCFECTALNTVSLATSPDEIYNIRCSACGETLFPGNKEKRKFDRYRCELEVYIDSIHDKIKCRGRCFNFSRSGMLLVTKIPLKKDQIITLNFAHDRNFKITAKIVRIEEIILGNVPFFKHGICYIRAQYEVDKQHSSSFTWYG